MRCVNSVPGLQIRSTGGAVLIRGTSKGDRARIARNGLRRERRPAKYQRRFGPTVSFVAQRAVVYPQPLRFGLPTLSPAAHVVLKYEPIMGGARLEAVRDSVQRRLFACAEKTSRHSPAAAGGGSGDSSAGSPSSANSGTTDLSAATSFRKRSITSSFSRSTW